MGVVVLRFPVANLAAGFIAVFIRHLDVALEMSGSVDRPPGGDNSRLLQNKTMGRERRQVEYIVRHPKLL